MANRAGVKPFVSVRKPLDLIPQSPIEEIMWEQIDAIMADKSGERYVQLYKFLMEVFK